MNILVLNGSPKGDKSVTKQYVDFIAKVFPKHKIAIINVAERINKIEKVERQFLEVLDEVRLAEGIIWAFPLYFFLVPAQYKRFIELIFEKCAMENFRGKYSAVITTSIHCMDHTAINYLNGIIDDMGMKYFGAFSAEMNDLLSRNGRKKLELFAADFFSAIKDGLITPRNYSPIVQGTFQYKAGTAKKKVETTGKKVLIVTDALEQDRNLNNMVNRLKGMFDPPAEVLNLNEVEIRGGCLGCIQCGYNNVCAYEKTDDFIDMYNKKVKVADVLILAGKIKDRYLSSRWKMFFDRSFFNTHIPSLIGKQIGVIISGPLRQVPNLRQIITAYVETQRANLLDFITDEDNNSEMLDDCLNGLAKRAISCSLNGYIAPPSFLAVGISKIFRDDVWGKLRFVFQADHRYYKKAGRYDFPQRQIKARLWNLFAMLLTSIPPVRRNFFTKQIIPGMIRPHERVLGKIKK